tara:strand:+ start:824 stop:1096 length:273 start_codon:yes stop_codon:yes gene_type:complete
MGKYFNGEYFPATDKASGLLRLGAQPIAAPPDWDDIQEGDALVCVVDNGFFQAASYIYDEGERAAFTQEDDLRPKRWFLMDKKIADNLAK